MRVHAIIPALDEAATIGAVVASVAPRVDQVIVVDNGSIDATGAQAIAAGARVVREPERGYGAACLAGIAAIEPADDSDIVIFIDGDGQSDPASIDDLLASLQSDDLELVIGSRVAGARPGALTGVQRFGNWLATRLLRGLYGARATDLGPTRAIRVGALRRLAMRDRGFGWTVEMQARAAMLGLRVGEVAVSYRRRAGGKSKISGTVRGSAMAGATILLTLHRARRPR